MNDNASEREKIAAVATLLSHFWVGIELASLRQRLLSEWLSDLSEFSVRNVVMACDHWRRTQDKRPAPANIIALCREVQPKHDPVPQYIPLPPLPQDTVREKWRSLPIHAWTRGELETANGEALFFARQRGYNTGDDRQDRLDYFKNALAMKHEGYDSANGCERWLRKTNIAKDLAK